MIRLLVAIIYISCCLIAIPFRPDSNFDSYQVIGHIIMVNILASMKLHHN